MRGALAGSSMRLMTDPTCFCGCGRSAAFGQARAVNAAARRVAERLAAGDPRCADGERLLRLALSVLHDDAPRAAHVAAALEVWVSAP
jgi:hypothetical protein